MTDALIARLRELFSNGLGIEVPDADTDLVAEGLLDSLALLEMLAIIEDEFQVRADLATFEVERFRTLQRLAGWIAINRDASGGSP